MRLPIPMRFFLPRRMAPSKCPANAFFCELTRKNRVFPQNEKLLFSKRFFRPRRMEKLANSNRPFPRFSGRNRTYSDAFFPPASNGTIEMPGERVFLRTNAEKPFSLKMKNRYFPLNNLS